VALRHHKRLKVSNLLQQSFLLFSRTALLQDHEPWKTRLAGNGSDTALVLWASLRESASSRIFNPLKDKFTNYLMLFRGIIDVCFENHTTHVKYSIGKMRVNFFNDFSTGDYTDE
jgi:hypothetical protein